MCQREAERISDLAVGLYWQYIVDNKNAENKQVWNQQLGKEYNIDEKIENNDCKLFIYKFMLPHHKRSRNIKETGLNISGAKAIKRIT